MGFFAIPYSSGEGEKRRTLDPRRALDAIINVAHKGGLALSIDFVVDAQNDVRQNMLHATEVLRSLAQRICAVALFV